jgi:hypothetical protein
MQPYIKILRYLIPLGIISLAIILWRSQTVYQQQSITSQQDAENVRILREHYREAIDRAKAEGKREIVLPPSMPVPLPDLSFDEAIHSHSLVQVKVDGSDIIVSQSESDGAVYINTWYKLQVANVLNEQPIVNDSQSPAKIPAQFQTIGPSEALLVRDGGSVNVDGIKITRIFTYNDPPLNENDEYLIAADLENGGRQIALALGSQGIFKITESGLRPLNPNAESRQIVQQVRDKFNNNLSRVQAYIQTSPRDQK